ncbi:hypothetical protein [Methylopila sp. M107]|uniref:pyroglutamyl-peptidase I family protein n=1 Tax=Methylopila sp. M107 TaxID=1101190 RepID=UPI00036CA9DF|nr:hypothetical protein [Methylopila sp. M107]
MRPSRATGPDARPADARLLVTAFGRFDGGPNCSETLLERLSFEAGELKSLWGGPVRFALLPVVSETAEQELRSALDVARPTHVLLTGQAAGRMHVSFERVARNHRHLAVPDEGGFAGALGPVREGGPAERVATWPDLDGLAAALSADGVAARVSEDAGAHLCNQTLYLALEAAEAASPRFVTTFLHLPLLPEQVAANVPAAARHENCFALPLDQMTRAVKRILIHTRRSLPTGLSLS